MHKSDAYKQRIREFLQPLDHTQWRTGREIAFAVAPTAQERAFVPQVVSAMRTSGELLREGEPPRGCRYRLNPDYVPEERDPHVGPASAYVGPALGDPALCPSIGTPIERMLPEAA